MNNIPGVTITNNEQGTPTHVSIDLAQHPDAIPALEELGLLPESDTDAEAGHTVEEFRQALHTAIKEHYATSNH